MTNQSPLPSLGRPVPTIPKGEVIATFDSYPEAQQAVDTLAEADFEVTQLSIVGSDLKTVERVTGKLSYPRVAGAGAASGAWLGLFFGLVLFLFTTSANSLLYMGAAIVIGAGFGVLFGVVSYAITRRTRDFTSSHQVLASRYEIILSDGPGTANKAKNILKNPKVVAAAEPEKDAPETTTPVTAED